MPAVTVASVPVVQALLNRMYSERCAVLAVPCCQHSVLCHAAHAQTGLGLVHWRGVTGLTEID